MGPVAQGPLHGFALVMRRGAGIAGQWPKLLQEVARTGIPFLAEAGGKRLADAIAALLYTLDTALGIDLEVPRRDYFPRNIRTKKPSKAAGQHSVKLRTSWAMRQAFRARSPSVPRSDHG